MPISLQHFDLSAANKVGTARRSKIGRNGLSISRIDFRVIHGNFDDEERGQFVTPPILECVEDHFIYSVQQVASE